MKSHTESPQRMDPFPEDGSLGPTLSTPPKRKKRALVLGVLLLAALLAGGTYYSARLNEPPTPKVWTGSFAPQIRSSYQGKSLLVMDLKQRETLVACNESLEVLPASIARLFVIDYALTLAQPEDELTARPQALELMKKGSSTAELTEGTYELQDLLAALLIPSGNDAAYVLADQLGMRMLGNVPSAQERVDAFMKGLAVHMKKRGYTHTHFQDPSGFDSKAVTTSSDVCAVTLRLCQNPLIQELIRKPEQILRRGDGGHQRMKNTNAFLDRSSKYFNPRVRGVKTGSLKKNFNIIVLYETANRDYLVLNFGSPSDARRYEDLIPLLKALDERDAVKHHPKPRGLRGRAEGLQGSARGLFSLGVFWLCSFGPTENPQCAKV
ncbi:hypothetical protein ABB02_00497 [Clostridiaceae bacterium JG1575]|nr:hypothetical protein ABB02_00497 [Clostridiaceae bacterium JG1575]